MVRMRPLLRRGGGNGGRPGHTRLPAWTSIGVLAVLMALLCFPRYAAAQADREVSLSDIAARLKANFERVKDLTVEIEFSKTYRSPPPAESPKKLHQRLLVATMGEDCLLWRQSESVSSEEALPQTYIRQCGWDKECYWRESEPLRVGGVGGTISPRNEADRIVLSLPASGFPCFGWDPFHFGPSLIESLERADAHIVGVREAEGEQCVVVRCYADVRRNRFRRKVFLSKDLGYASVRWEVFIRGHIREIGRVTKFKEILPGLWFPEELIWEWDVGAASFDRVSWPMTFKVLHLEVNQDLPADMFAPSFEPGTKVEDSRSGTAKIFLWGLGPDASGGRPEAFAPVSENKFRPARLAAKKAPPKRSGSIPPVTPGEVDGVKTERKKPVVSWTACIVIAFVLVDVALLLAARKIRAPEARQGEDEAGL